MWRCVIGELDADVSNEPTTFVLKYAKFPEEINPTLVSVLPSGYENLNLLGTELHPLSTPFYCFIYKSHYVIRGHYVRNKSHSAPYCVVSNLCLSYVQLLKALLLLASYCCFSFICVHIDFYDRLIFMQQTAVRQSATQSPFTDVFEDHPNSIRERNAAIPFRHSCLTARIITEWRTNAVR